MRVVSDFREAMWGVLQQGISTLDVDFVAYAAEHFDRLLAQRGHARLRARAARGRGRLTGASGRGPRVAAGRSVAGRRAAVGEVARRSG